MSTAEDCLPVYVENTPFGVLNVHKLSVEKDFITKFYDNSDELTSSLDEVGLSDVEVTNMVTQTRPNDEKADSIMNLIMNLKNGLPDKATGLYYQTNFWNGLNNILPGYKIDESWNSINITDNSALPFAELYAKSKTRDPCFEKTVNGVVTDMLNIVKRLESVHQSCGVEARPARESIQASPMTGESYGGDNIKHKKKRVQKKKNVSDKSRGKK